MTSRQLCSCDFRRLMSIEHTHTHNNKQKWGKFCEIFQKIFPCVFVYLCVFLLLCLFIFIGIIIIVNFFSVTYWWCFRHVNTHINSEKNTETQKHKITDFICPILDINEKEKNWVASELRAHKRHTKQNKTRYINKSSSLVVALYICVNHLTNLLFFLSLLFRSMIPKYYIMFR